MPEFNNFGGKYNPRSAFYNAAQQYWIAQFWDIVGRARIGTVTNEATG